MSPNPKVAILIDPPSPFDPIEVWQAFLGRMRAERHAAVAEGGEPNPAIIEAIEQAEAHVAGTSR